MPRPASQADRPLVIPSPRDRDRLRDPGGHHPHRGGPHAVRPGRGGHAPREARGPARRPAPALRARRPLRARGGRPDPRGADRLRRGGLLQPVRPGLDAAASARATSPTTWPGRRSTTSAGPHHWLGTFALSHWAFGPSVVLEQLTAEARERALPDLVSGRRSMCFGLSEPGAGSDATMITTRAVAEGARLADLRPQDVDVEHHVRGLDRGLRGDRSGPRRGQARRHQRVPGADRLARLRARG